MLHDHKLNAGHNFQNVPYLLKVYTLDSGYYDISLCFTAKFSTEFLSVLLHPAIILWIDFSNSAILSNASQRWVRADWEFRLAQVLDSQLRCWLCVHCGVVGWRGDLVYVSSHWYLPPHLCFFRSFPSSFQSHFIHPTSDSSLWNLWLSKLSAYLKWWSSKKPPRSPRSLKTKALWFVKLIFFFPFSIGHYVMTKEPLHMHFTSIFTLRVLQILDNLFPTRNLEWSMTFYYKNHLFLCSGPSILSDASYRRVCFAWQFSNTEMFDPQFCGRFCVNHRMDWWRGTQFSTRRHLQWWW